MSIVQAVLTHIVLTKRKVILDQFREGLKLLGGLDQITAHPKLYEKLFVAGMKTMLPTFSIRFPS